MAKDKLSLVDVNAGAGMVVHALSCDLPKGVFPIDFENRQFFFNQTVITFPPNTGPTLNIEYMLLVINGQKGNYIWVQKLANPTIVQIGQTVSFAPSLVVINYIDMQPIVSYKQSLVPQHSVANVPILPVDLSRYPHLCPRCKAPAYIGFSKTECSKGC